MSKKEIRNALQNKEVVHWCNAKYNVVEGYYDNKLYVVCSENEFTSLLVESDLADCYIKNN